ncbi:MAG: hypothetical protein WKG07_11750 [Hymenobacter sp.]
MGLGSGGGPASVFCRPSPTAILPTPARPSGRQPARFDRETRWTAARAAHVTQPHRQQELLRGAAAQPAPVWLRGQVV